MCHSVPAWCEASRRSGVWNVNPTFATGRRLQNPEEDRGYCLWIDVKLESTPLRPSGFNFRHLSERPGLFCPGRLRTAKKTSRFRAPRLPVSTVYLVTGWLK